MNAFHEQLLRSIRNHDGEWTWYQLARIIDFAELPHRTNLMTLLKELKSAGLITEGPGPNSSQPAYFITADGAAALERIDHESEPVPPEKAIREDGQGADD